MKVETNLLPLNFIRIDPERVLPSSGSFEVSLEVVSMIIIGSVYFQV